MTAIRDRHDGGFAAATTIFLHIPKTGGLTLRDVLRRQVAPSELYEPRLRPNAARVHHLRHVVDGADAPEVHYGSDRNRGHLDALAAMSPDGVAALRLLYGHFWFGIHEALPGRGGSSTYVTILRHPVERVLSLYHHRVERHGLRQSVEEYVAADRDVAARDGQARRLVGSSSELYRVPVTDEMLATAKRNIEERFALVGLTERFDETVVLLGRIFGWKDLRYVRRNVGSGRPRRESVAPDAITAIEERNRYDLELYRFAVARFDEQVRATGPGFPEEVRRFQVRNDRYRTVAEPMARIAERVRERTMPARRIVSRMRHGGTAR